MGLFSFLKNAGAKAFNTKKETTTIPDTSDIDLHALLNEQKAQSLEKLVNSMQLNVSDLDITVDDDVVTIYGNADTQTDKEKLILLLGNVEGISAVDDYVNVLNIDPNDSPTVSYDPSVNTNDHTNFDGSGSQFHTVVKGDSLSKIAKAYYGDMMKYPVIFEANQPMLTDPGKIYPGQVLRIPALA